MVEVVPAQSRVTAGCKHLKNPFRELEKRHIERAAAQIVDKIEPFGAVVEPVGERSGGGFVQKAKHREVRKPRGILRRLTLSVVEISGHRDDCARKGFASEACFGAVAQGLENLGAHLHRRLGTRRRADAQHPFGVFDFIRQMLGVLDVGETTADQTLGGGNSVGRVGLGRRKGVRSRHDASVSEVADHGGKELSPCFVGDHFGACADHARHERIGRAEVDPHGQTVFVRGG